MKKIALFLLPLLISLKSYEQKVPNIRFIHVGDELKPIGTLLISIGEYVKPTDRPFDSVFGVGVKTDERTFKFIDNYVLKSNYTKEASVVSKSDTNAYKIVCPHNLILYVNMRNSYIFFENLRSGLKKENLDTAVINALKRYF